MSADNKQIWLPRDLPDGRALVEEGRRLGGTVKVGRSLLCQKYGVRNEIEYKKKMRAEGRLMRSLNIGLNTWRETAEGLRRIHEGCEERGFRVDRYQMQLDRRMGLPPEMWEKAPAETGPLLRTRDDWMEVSQAAPIQPQLGDMMIGSPMSVSNAMHALEAGVNYIGNMSQFAWKYPGWPGTETDQMVEMTKALGLMASKRDDGCIFQSYLEDGYPAQFKDYCSYIGWVMFERYLITDVVGANLSIGYGGLTHDPIMKAAVILAIEELTPPELCNSFYHCNTTAQTKTVDNNYAVVSIDDLFIALAIRKSNSGAAMLSIPVTEAIRIPTWQEVVQVQTIAERTIAYAGNLGETIDWGYFEAIKEKLLAGGRRYFDNIMNGLQELKVDLRDPLQILMAIRSLGGVEIENRWGVGELPKDNTEIYHPVFPTDTFKDYETYRSGVRNYFSGLGDKVDQRQRVIVGSTDIHEYAMLLAVDALRELGISPIVAGTSVDPDEFADLALETDASAILISTHNGMALTYAQHLLGELKKREIAIPVGIGGTLNQDFEGEPAPLDVTDKLSEMGLIVCAQINDLLEIVKRPGSNSMNAEGWLS